MVGRGMAEGRQAGGLLDAAPDAIIGVDAWGLIVLVNAQAERLFGYPREDLLGQPLEILVPEAARGVHPGHRGDYLTDPRPRPMGAGIELAGRRRDGTEFPAEISLSAIETEDGLVISAAVRDVTARKRAEAKFRGFLEAAPDAIVGVSADGLVVLVNAQAENLFGYRRDELVGQPLDMLLPESARGVHSRHRAAYLRDPRPRPMGAGMELAGRRRDGSEFPAEISLSAIETEDGTVVAAAVRDVTSRKVIEQELRDKNTQLQRMVRAKDTFLAKMSHELRTPLNAVIGFAGALLMELPGPLTEEQRRQLGIVQHNARHLLSIIDDLLDFAKIESGAVKLSLQPVDCVEVISNVTATLQPLAEKKSLALTVDLVPVEEVRSDARALSQILLNLLGNAIKFTDAGSVSVRLRPPTAERGTTIAISDTGPGIAADDLAVLFNAFERGRDQSVHGRDGTGLGLHISRRLADLAGMTIEVESQLGAGSTFSVEFGDQE